MVIIAKAVLRELGMKYSDAKEALAKWYFETKLVIGKALQMLKKTFNSVDFVGNGPYVFNIKGNKFRLITLILFKVRTVFILYIGAHKDYDHVIAAKAELKKH